MTRRCKYIHSTCVLGCRRKDIQVLVEDHIKSLILKDFDPKKADLIFTEEGSVSPHTHTLGLDKFFECLPDPFLAKRDDLFSNMERVILSID